MQDHDQAALRIDAEMCLAEAGWSRITDRIIHGFCHDLNGRVTSLEAIRQLVEMGEPVPDLSIESDRLGNAARGLALMAGDLGEVASGAMLEDILHDAMKLVMKARRDLPEPGAVTVEPDLMPVRVGPTRSRQGMALLVDTVATAIGGLPEINIEGDEEVVRLVLTTHGRYSDSSSQVMDALGRLFALDGGQLDASDPVTLTYPSLAALRAARTNS